MSLERPQNELHKYGVLKARADSGWEYLEDFVEKPSPGMAPSNMINISKYILTPATMSYFEAIKLNPEHQEYFITDGILATAKEYKMVVHRAKGQYVDSGSVSGWLRANLTVAASQPDLDKLARQNTTQ
jgi:UTP--glucose-1-phosphate uridylyltransferase